MAFWLFKEEPTHYNFADLEREGATLWDGVSNALARKHLRQVQQGDAAFFYHTGKEKAVVGEMRVVGGPEAGPGGAGDVVVRVEVVARLPRPVSLAEIRDDPVLAGWDLVRLPRLSVVPVTPEQWQQVQRLSRRA